MWQQTNQEKKWGRVVFWQGKTLGFVNISSDTRSVSFWSIRYSVFCLRLVQHIPWIRIHCNTELWQTQFFLASSHDQFVPSLPCFIACMFTALFMFHSEHLKTGFSHFHLFSVCITVKMNFRLSIWTYAQKCLWVFASVGINIKVPICFSGAGSSLMLPTTKIMHF